MYRYYAYGVVKRGAKRIDHEIEYHGNNLDRAREKLHHQINKGAYVYGYIYHGMDSIEYLGKQASLTTV